MRPTTRNTSAATTDAIKTVGTRRAHGRTVTAAELAQFGRLLRKRLATLDRIHRRMVRRRWWRIEPCYRWLQQAREGLAGAIAAVEMEISHRRPPPPQQPKVLPVEEGWEEELAEDACRHPGAEMRHAMTGG